jgi:hypothetical protein
VNAFPFAHEVCNNENLSDAKTEKNAGNATLGHAFKSRSQFFSKFRLSVLHIGAKSIEFIKGTVFQSED